VKKDVPLDTNSFFLRHRFDDFDAFCEASRGWDLDFRQLDGGTFEGDMTQIVSGPTRVVRGRFNRKLTQFGSPPTRHWTFGIPAEPGVAFRSRGYEVNDHHLLVFPQGGEMDGLSFPGFHIFAVSIADEMIVRLCDQLGLPPFEEIVRNREIVACPPGVIRALREVGSRIVAGADDHPGLLADAAFRHELQASWPALIVEAFGASRVVARRPLAQVRSRALKCALSVVAARAHEPLAITELYELSGASGRTLRYAFEEEFGLSPKQYLQAHRLNGVRRELRHGDATTKVADAANAWGFWHMGQFAADYRKMFGELPGVTLALRVRSKRSLQGFNQPT
jgi:AraC-like DNA-binding protein